MNELEKLKKRKKRTRHILITVSVHAVHPDRLCKECFKGNSDCNSGSGGD